MIAAVYRYSFLGLPVLVLPSFMGSKVSTCVAPLKKDGSLPQNIDRIEASFGCGEYISESPTFSPTI
jgi:hypothetical protein